MAGPVKKTTAVSSRPVRVMRSFGRILVTAVIIVTLSYIVIVLGKYPADIGWLSLLIGFSGLFVVIPAIFANLWYGRIAVSQNGMPWLEARTKIMRLEVSLIACLVAVACAALAASYLASRSVFASVQEQKFGPSETAQVITAASGLGLAIGTSIAAIIKAYALLIRARADYLRAKFDPSPDKDYTMRVDRQLSGPE